VDGGKWLRSVRWWSLIADIPERRLAR